MAKDKDRPETIGGHRATDDRDNPIWTEDDFKHAQGREALGAAELAAFPRTAARLGRPPSSNAKSAVKLRLDPDVLAAFKADGPGWQTRINAELRGAVARRRGQERLSR